MSGNDDSGGGAGRHAALEMLERLPEELRALPQWCCADADGRPFVPGGRPASTAAPSTWSSFGACCQAVRDGALSADGTPLVHVGFVLATGGPFTIVDLDDKVRDPATEKQRARHREILDAFGGRTTEGPRCSTYIERSRSGRGYHIIGRGSVPKGLHRDHVEVYSEKHFMVCTGDAVNAVTVADCQELLDVLAREMDRATAEPSELVETPEDPDDVDASDRDLVEMAVRAADGEKFTALCNGRWQEVRNELGVCPYPSQSEADLALMSLFCFYTQVNEQVRRLFRYSRLADRPKADRRDYIERTLAKARSGQPPPVDAEALREQAAVVVAGAARTVPTTGALTCPAGLVGELAWYFYTSAFKPVPEVAIVAALGFVAGIAGRQFNTSTGAGLNLYLILLGETGIGKECGKDGIERLMNEVCKVVPIADRFMGPAHIASGQALIRRLDEQPCLVSVLGEFGKELRRITSPRANTAEQALVKVLLGLYSQSGQAKKLRESVYADKEKNTRIVQSPSFTLVGESTPDTFFEGLDESHIADGLVPRFLTVSCEAKRPPSNRSANAPPPADLVRRVANLVEVVERMAALNQFTEVSHSAGADSLLWEFDAEGDGRINSAGRGEDVVRHAWNRAHLHALKVASALAVGCWLALDDPRRQHPPPLITGGQATWAIDLVRSSVNAVLGRFERGDVGGGDEAKAEATVRRKVLALLGMTAEERSRVRGVPKSMPDGLIPYAYLRDQTKRVPPFNTARGLLDSVLAQMVRGEALEKLTLAQARQLIKGHKGGDVYVLGPEWK